MNLLRSDAIRDVDEVAVISTGEPAAVDADSVDFAEADDGLSPDSDPTDPRCLRRAEALRAARRLDAAPRLSERVDIYNHYGRSPIFLAAALAPDLMPRLNGEFEFLVLASADVE